MVWAVDSFGAREMTMENNAAKLAHIWNHCPPVVMRRARKGHRLRVRLPYAADNRHWLNGGRRRSAAKWLAEEQCWRIPASWFNDLVERALDRFGRLYVIQPYREQEKCAPACLNAVGHECQCSCMGANHGAGNDGSWFEVSETFAARWGDEHLACRLMTRNRSRGNDRARAEYIAAMRLLAAF